MQLWFWTLLDPVCVGRLCHVVILFGADAEVPIIDGSALGWASEIVRAGLQDARDAAGIEASVHPTASLPQEVCEPFLVLVSRRNAWCCSMETGLWERTGRLVPRASLLINRLTEAPPAGNHCARWRVLHIILPWPNFSRHRCVAWLLAYRPQLHPGMLSVVAILGDFRSTGQLICRPPICTASQQLG